MSDIKKAPEEIGAEVDALQKAQADILTKYQAMNGKEVRRAVAETDQINLEQRARQH